MARPKSYDREEVILRVRDSFWKHGYQGLGIRTIEEETGLGRFAIRTEFGGKEGLMVEAMKAYTADTETYVYAKLAESEDVQTLVDMLDGMVAPHPETLRHFGCLMVNTTIENAEIDSDVLRAGTNHHFERLRSEAHDLVMRAQAAGSAKTDIEPAAAAEFVVGSVMAVMVMNRASGSASGGKGYVAEAARTIQSWSR